MDNGQLYADWRREVTTFMATGTRVTASTASTNPFAPTVPPADIFTATAESPILCTSLHRGPLKVALVGAGGNGARLTPPLMQMLRQGDQVSIIDNDIVEDRNLVRQHFTQADIGRHKAVVLAERYSRAGRIEINAFTARIDKENVRGVFQEAHNNAALLALRAPTPAHIIFGCVDNAETRVHIEKYCERAGRDGQMLCWIDVGNETRGGQAIMSLYNWHLKVLAGGLITDGKFQLHTIKHAMPQLLIPDPAAAARESCGERIDMQTVQVNHLAAAAALNCLSWLMLGIPFAAAGVFFSTLNTMQPIQIASINRRTSTLLPSTAFAAKAEAEDSPF